MCDGAVLSEGIATQLTRCVAETHRGRSLPGLRLKRCRAARAIGVDVVDVQRLQRLIRRSGDQLLERLFTERELRLCDGASDRYRWYCLAGRLAAKEATKKTFGSWGGGVGWLDMEILRQIGGKPTLLLRDRAEEAARSAAFSDIYISISHDAGVSLAVSMAV